jgi:two-component system chemotaxis response regulator CheY
MTQSSVLVVDDDAELRQAVASVLVQAGYRVTQAPDGVAGLEKARAERPSVILLDVNMPRLGGWAFLSRRLADTILIETPIILMTGDHLGVSDLATTVAGPVGFLYKPLSFAELLDQVARWAPP